MTSKVEYLSKYITTKADDDNNNNNERRSRKHHKKSKKKHKSERNSGNVVRQSRLIDIDKEIDITSVLPHENTDEEDEQLDNNDDDIPVVVINADEVDNKFGNDDAGSIRHHVPRGTWENELPQSNHRSHPLKQQRRRHDSDSSDPRSDNEKSIPAVQRGRRDKKRHDSSDDDDDDENQRRSINKRRRHDSDSELDDNDKHDRNPNQRKQRHDTDSDDDGDNMNRSKRPSIENDIVPLQVQSRHRRHDSSSEDDKNDRSSRQHHQRKRERHDSSDSSDNESYERTKSNERMSSGHKSGIQSSTDFSRREKKLQQKKVEATKEFVRKHGISSETIYRDRESGQILDHDQQATLQQKQNNQKNKIVLSAEEQLLLNSGRVQLEQQEQMKREFDRLHEATFARHRDDTELDTILKSKIHPDDPMAMYAMKQQSTKKSITSNDGSTVQQQQKQRPIYKGPAPKPNRFNIAPGYRWDARDRGNGFEDKLLAKQYNQQHQKEQSYRYSSADM